MRGPRLSNERWQTADFSRTSTRMSAKSFQSDVAELGWTRKRLAETLGISTETLRVWLDRGPPEVGRIAVAAMAKGFRL